MNRIRNKQFNIRLTEKELAAFEKKRAASGFCKTDFFNKLVCSANIKVYRFDDEVREIMHELRKIGVNLNQVAYLVNGNIQLRFESDHQRRRAHPKAICTASRHIRADDQSSH